jgi:HPt (histidine-containing phosphotransfer) domain-containing protein
MKNQKKYTCFLIKDYIDVKKQMIKLDSVSNEYREQLEDEIEDLKKSLDILEQFYNINEGD